MLVSGGAAVGLEFIAYRPLRKRNAKALTFLITAIGMSFVLQQFVLFILPKLIPGYGGPNAQQPHRPGATRRPSSNCSVSRSPTPPS